MQKIFVLVTFLFFGSYCCVAQKVIEKEYSVDGINTISIKDDSIFKIKITSSERESIKTAFHISGEHSETIIIEESLIEEKLLLKTGVMPYFAFENDKLAAHKVMAVEVELHIPEHISVEIKSKLASVESIGNIQNLEVFLQNGNCSVVDFLGNAHLKTELGDIKVSAKKNVAGKAISKNGTVKNTLPRKGKFLVDAESINGNINLSQTK